MRCSRAPRAPRCSRHCCAAARGPPLQRRRRRATSCCTRPASACGSLPSTRPPCRPWRAPTSCPALSTWPATPPRKRCCSVNAKIQDLLFAPRAAPFLSCPWCIWMADILQDNELLCVSQASPLSSRACCVWMAEMLAYDRALWCGGRWCVWLCWRCKIYWRRLAWSWHRRWWRPVCPRSSSSASCRSASSPELPVLNTPMSIASTDTIGHLSWSISAKCRSIAAVRRVGGSYGFWGVEKQIICGCAELGG